MITKVIGIASAEEYSLMHKVLTVKPSAFCAADFYGIEIQRYIIYLEDEKNCFKIYQYAEGKTRQEAWQTALDNIGREMLDKLESYAE